MPGLMRALLQLGERNMLFMLLALVVLMLLVNQVSASQEEALPPILFPNAPGDDGRFNICIGDQGYSLLDSHAMNNLYGRVPYAGPTSYHIAINDLMIIAGRAQESLSSAGIRDVFEYVIENLSGFSVPSSHNLFGTGDTELVRRIPLEECLSSVSDWMRGNYLSSLNP